MRYLKLQSIIHLWQGANLSWGAAREREVNEREKPSSFTSPISEPNPHLRAGARNQEVKM